MPSTRNELNAKDPAHWNLVEAVALVAQLQPEAYKAGYYIALAGGAVTNGYSTNDLDLIAMKRLHVEQDEFALLDAFLQRGWLVDAKYTRPQIRWKLRGKAQLIDLTFGCWL